MIGPRGDEHFPWRSLDTSIVRHLLDEKCAQSHMAQWTAIHVIGGKLPPLLAQSAGRGGNEVFDGNFVRVIMSADEVVRWKSSPRLCTGGQVFGEQSGIVETLGSHTRLLSCGNVSCVKRSIGTAPWPTIPVGDDSCLSISQPCLLPVLAGVETANPLYKIGYGEA